MTPMTRGSVMANTQRDMGSNPIRTVRTVSLVVRARRDTGIVFQSTMGRYIETHSGQSTSLVTGYSPAPYGAEVDGSIP